MQTDFSHQSQVVQSGRSKKQGSNPDRHQNGLSSLFVKVGLVLIVLAVGILVFGWLLMSGGSVLLQSDTAAIVVFVPQGVAETQSIAVSVLDPLSHRNKLWFVTATTPISLQQSSDTAALTQQLGIATSEVYPLSVTQLQPHIKLLVARQALLSWKEPQKLLRLASLAVLLPSSETVPVTDAHSWGEALALQLQPLEDAANDCPLGVSNTTGVSGLGRSFGQFLTNQGLTVRRVTDRDDTLGQTQVLYDETAAQSCQALLMALKHVLPAQTPFSSREGILGEYRVPVMILLGEDSVWLLNRQ